MRETDRYRESDRERVTEIVTVSVAERVTERE